jgi:leucyl aminopeptidase
LTGACWAALGDNTAGIFSNNDELAKEINDIGETVSENFWRLPVTAEHFDLMKGDHSDLCNVGKGKVMGA